MFSIVELKTATLDYGTPGISQTLLVLLFLMMLGISMIPYLFLFLSLRENQSRASLLVKASHVTEKPFNKVIAWMHAHRHPQLLHH